jgi:hypothetical protein
MDGNGKGPVLCGSFSVDWWIKKGTTEATGWNWLLVVAALDFWWGESGEAWLLRLGLGWDIQIVEKK